MTDETRAAIPRPRRWDLPFGRRTDEADLELMLATPPFSRIDRSAFRAPLTLENLLDNDARIRRFEAGEIVLRQGDYGHSAFLLRSGAVAFDIDGLPQVDLGRRAAGRRPSALETLRHLWGRSAQPEVRTYSKVGLRTTIARKADRAEDRRTTLFVRDLPSIFGDGSKNVIESGEWFGLLSAFGRTPRTATIVAGAGGAEAIEIRWQGLRDILRRAPDLRRHTEERYRRLRLASHLRATPLFERLSPEEIDVLVGATRFESYGRFDWYGEFRRQADLSERERLEAEPILLAAGDVPDGVILVASGLVRVTEPYHDGERTWSYLGRGGVFGLESIAGRASPGEEPLPSAHTLRAMGYVDVLVVPWPILDSLGIRPGSVAGRAIGAPPIAVESGLLEFLVDHRHVNGTATMVIDLERCTRCDDCVAACAATHGNNPRFVREGPRVDNLQIAGACMHCRDPVCMIGCPTGAIHRHLTGGEVVINDLTCIGCSACAHACPYDMIRMVQVRDRRGEPIQDLEKGDLIRKATKCDLCLDVVGGPACQMACGQDALRRVDLSDLEELVRWHDR